MTSAEVFHKLVSEFPCMMPHDSTFAAYSGFVRIKEKEYRVSIASDCSRFDAEEDLKDVLGSQLSVLNDRLQTASDPHEFLVELRDLAERAMGKDADKRVEIDANLPTARYYERLLSEISGIGWGRVVWMDERMRVIDLEIQDSRNRRHTVNLTLPRDYPSHPPKCVASLPRPFELQWNPRHSLRSLIQQFEGEVEKYQQFFQAVEDLDENTWVLEPEHPTWRETYRRVALGKQCSARIEIDPRAPIKGFPECRFLGSESAIAPFRQRLNQNIHRWDTSGKTLPRENLERILELTFPLKKTDDGGAEEDMSIECGICYTYRLEDRVPDIACDLEECSKPYHRQCLIDWFRALPDTRESFGTIAGNCVYCEHAITVSVKGL